MTKPPLPPFTVETAAQKARLAEDAWNTRDPKRVAAAIMLDSSWRNRAEFFSGLMQRREASINDVRIAEAERKFHWPLGCRRDEHPDYRNWGCEKTARSCRRARARRSTKTPCAENF